MQEYLVIVVEDARIKLEPIKRTVAEERAEVELTLPWI